MVLLTMTEAMVRGLEKRGETVEEKGEEKHEEQHEDQQDNSKDDKDRATTSTTTTTTAAATPASTTSTEPPLDAPAIGKPISHGQIFQLWQTLRADAVSLESLLVGARVYVPPPAPKPEPTPQYKALMARLRRDAEARAYDRMVHPPDPLYRASNEAFARVHGPVQTADVDDEVTLNDVHRQIMLILNFVLTMGGVAYTLWVLARWWPTPSRLFLAMGGSVLVGIAEYGLYAGYVWHLSDAKAREAKQSRAERKAVLRTWVVSTGGVEEMAEPTAAKTQETAAEEQQTATTTTLVAEAQPPSGVDTEDASGLRRRAPVDKAS